MDPQLFELADAFEDHCRYIIERQQGPTKIRITLRGDYFFDIFYRAKTSNYSYSLIRDEGRVIGWNNAPHYTDLPNYPHHFHAEDGRVIGSSLGEMALQDIVHVANAINEYLRGKVNE